MKIQLKRSNVLVGSAAKSPSAGQMEYGELAVNYNETDPAIFIKDSNNNIIRIAGADNIADDGTTNVPSGTTPPANPESGNLWFNDEEGRLYIYYVDADSSQWVDASPDSWDPSSYPDVGIDTPQAGTLDDRYLMLNAANDPITSDLQIQGKLDVTSDIGGTVDGRDVAADGLKLDGIETGADVSQWVDITGGINYPDGNVGIGTTGFDNLGFQNSPSLGIFSSDGGTRLGLWGKGGRWWYMHGEGENRFSIGCRTSSNTVDSTKLAIISNGNVGIGTESPINTLDVIGVLSARPQDAGGNYGIAAINGNSGSQAGITIKSSFSQGGYGPTIFNNGGTEVARIEASGNFGIGVEPEVSLHVSKGVNWNFPLLALQRERSNTTDSAFIQFALDGDTLNINPKVENAYIGLLTDTAPGDGDTVNGQNAKLELCAPKGSVVLFGGSGTVPSTTGSVDTTVGLTIARDSVGFDFGILDNGNSYIQNRRKTDFATNYDLLLNPNGGKVGVGTTSPFARLDVYGGVIGEDAGDELEVARFRTSNGNGESLRFYSSRRGAGTSWSQTSSIIQRRIDSTDQGYIEFGPDDGTSIGSYDIGIGSRDGEVLRVRSNGSVGVSTTSPSTFAGDCRFAVAKPGGARIGFSGSARSWYLEGRTDIDACTIGNRGQSNTVDNPKLNILVGGGISFGTDTADANALDDYEEGTWTPVPRPANTVLGGVTNPTLGAGATHSGRYTKIGNMCYLQVRSDFDAAAITPQPNDRVIYDGLPYQPKSGYGVRASGTALVYGYIGLGSNALGTAIVATDSTVDFIIHDVLGTVNYGKNVTIMASYEVE